MTTQQKYKTKPLDCWQWGKELRLEAYQDLVTGHEKGKLLVLCLNHDIEVISVVIEGRKHIIRVSLRLNLGIVIFFAPRLSIVYNRFDITPR